MAKLHLYLTTLIVLILLFNFGGLINDTGTSYILSVMNLRDPQNFSTTQFYLLLTGITAIALVGVVIGTVLGKTAGLTLLPSILAMATLFFLIGWDIITLFNILKVTNSFLAVMVASPMLVIFVLTVVEWVRGMQT